MLRLRVTSVLHHFSHISESDLTTKTTRALQDSEMFPLTTRELKVRSAVPDSRDIFFLDFSGCETCLNVFVGGNFAQILSAQLPSPTVTILTPPHKRRQHAWTTESVSSGPTGHFLSWSHRHLNRSTDRQQRCCCHRSMKCSFCPSVILNRWSEDARCFQTSALQKINEEIRIKGCET